MLILVLSFEWIYKLLLYKLGFDKRCKDGDVCYLVLILKL